MRSARICFLSRDSNARARSSFPQVACAVIVCEPRAPMEPMQLEGAGPASCDGSDDRGNFRGDYYELKCLSVERCRMACAAVGVLVRRCSRRLLDVCIKHTSHRQVVERLAVRRLVSRSMRTSRGKRWKSSRAPCRVRTIDIACWASADKRSARKVKSSQVT